MANRYDVGDVVRLQGTWTDSIGDGVPVDPDNVYCDVTTPAGTSVTYTYEGSPALSRLSEGIYYVDIDVDSSGKWKYRFYSTGIGKAAEREFLIVDPA